MFPHTSGHTGAQWSCRSRPITAPHTSIMHHRVRLRQHPQCMATSQLQQHTAVIIIIITVEIPRAKSDRWFTKNKNKTCYKVEESDINRTTNTSDCEQSNYSSCIVSSHIPTEFGQTRISAIRSADTVPNTEWKYRPNPAGVENTGVSIIGLQ